MPENQSICSLQQRRYVLERLKFNLSAAKLRGEKKSPKDSPQEAMHFEVAKIKL